MIRGEQRIVCTRRLDPVGLAYLRARPVAHELLLGLWEQAKVAHARAWWVVCSGQAVEGVARFDPPTSLIFSAMPPGAAQVLADELRPFVPAVAAVHAPAALAPILATHLNLSKEPQRSQVLSLEAPPSQVSGYGELKVVGLEERPRLRNLVEACVLEFSGAKGHPSTISYWSQCEHCYFFRDEQQHLVALAIQNRRHAWGACLGLVYTLPQHRQRGHAKAMLTRLCSTLFRQGHGPVFLHLRAQQAPAQALYRALGFESVQTLVSWGKVDALPHSIPHCES